MYRIGAFQGVWEEESSASSRKAGRDTVHGVTLGKLPAAGARLQAKDWQTVRPEDGIIFCLL